MKAGHKQSRPAGLSPPCYECPKKSPQEAHKFELKERDLRAVKLYFRARAVGWRGVPESLASEPLFGRVMSIIDRTVRAHEQERASSLLALQFLPFVRIAKGAS